MQANVKTLRKRFRFVIANIIGPAIGCAYFLVWCVYWLDGLLLHGWISVGIEQLAIRLFNPSQASIEHAENVFGIVFVSLPVVAILLAIALLGISIPFTWARLHRVRWRP